MKVGENVVFDEMVRKLKEGVDITIENVDITEEFEQRYKEYQEQVENRENDTNEFQ